MRCDLASRGGDGIGQSGRCLGAGIGRQQCGKICRGAQCNTGRDEDLAKFDDGTIDALAGGLFADAERLPNLTKAAILIEPQEQGLAISIGQSIHRLLKGGKDPLPGRVALLGVVGFAAHGRRFLFMPPAVLLKPKGVGRCISSCLEQPVGQSPGIAD